MLLMRSYLVSGVKKFLLLSPINGIIDLCPFHISLFVKTFSILKIFLFWTRLLGECSLSICLRGSFVCWEMTVKYIYEKD